MLNHIGIDIISTIDPRSKGRIERLWRTFQDRLCKELKKKNNNTIEKANQYIKDVFLPKYNARFASEIDYKKNSFIKVDGNFNFNKELAVWSEHKIYHHCYLKYNKQYYVILKDEEKTYLSTNSKVNVFTFIDGTDHILFNNEWFNLKPIKDFKITPTNSIKSTKTKKKLIFLKLTNLLAIILGLNKVPNKVLLYLLYFYTIY